MWKWDTIERKRSRSTANCSIDSKQIQYLLAVDIPTYSRDCNILTGWLLKQYQSFTFGERQATAVPAATSSITENATALVVAAFTPFTCNHTYTHTHMSLLFAAACLPSTKTAARVDIHLHDSLDFASSIERNNGACDKTAHRYTSNVLAVYRCTCMWLCEVFFVHTCAAVGMAVFFLICVRAIE